jgi:predicted adenylyl cyclase CyaB
MASSISHINVEIKARTSDHKKIREILNLHKAEFIGVDHQVDTYFKIPSGRLKLREGNIENHLIYYERENNTGPKESTVLLYKHSPGSGLKELLTKSLGIIAVIDKQREIYFIGNVKFHLDVVEGLGTFMEIEAIDKDGIIGNEKLLEQCIYYTTLLGIKKENMISVSYCDLILG